MSRRDDLRTENQNNLFDQLDRVEDDVFTQLDQVKDDIPGEKLKNARKEKRQTKPFIPEPTLAYETREEREISDPKEVRKVRRRKREKNRPFILVTYASVLLFLAMMAYIGYYVVFRSATFVSDAHNRRQDLYADQVIRGPIVDARGNVLAETVVNEDGSEYRSYPYGQLFCHVVGYSEMGKTGLEARNNFNLMSSHIFILEKIQNDISGNKDIGDTLITTLDLDVQAAAQEALQGHRGAAVAIEPKSGRIVAMYANPGFNPNNIAEEWESLNADGENAPLLNRATQGLYPPGSTFKTITALELMREDDHYIEYAYDCEGQISYEDVQISCFDGNVHGHVNLTDAFAYSCNSAFANLGLKLDGNKMKDTAEDLLFNKTLPCPISSTKSRFPLSGASSAGEKMMTMMGQGDTLVSPYHMALITCAIANDGVLASPHLVDQVVNSSGQNVDIDYLRTLRSRRLMSEEESRNLKSLMKSVVDYGTATELANPSYSVAGKTGTAEYSDDKSKSHSWFIGFSDIDDPDLVVSVIVEGYDGDPNYRAIPVARRILEAYHNIYTNE